MRIYSAAALLLAGCTSEQGATQPEGERIDCAIGEGSDFGRDCTVERGADGAMTIHAPDGGFRRFVLTDEGLRAADGAEEARVTEAGDVVELAIGDDRYRLPR